MKAPRPNSVRIIAGAWRGRRLGFPATLELRPTPDRVRETLFNWLGQDLTGKRCLDLFAGSGALGFEALSRNAAHVSFVENSASAVDAIRANAAKLGAERHELRRGDALEFLRRTASESFDVVFLDPPFGAGWLARAMPLLAPCLRPAGLIYLESEASIALPPAAANGEWRIVRSARAGAVHYALAQFERPAGEGK